MAEFTLKPKKAKTLKVNIGEESFHIPLAAYLTPKEAAQLDTAKGTQDFFRKYISKEVADELTIDDFNQITQAYIKESNKVSGKTVGE